MDSVLQDKLDNFKSHLVMIKSLKDQQADDQFYSLLQKAKQVLGDQSPYIANFYLQYGSFLLSKIQKSMDMLNAGAVPQQRSIDQMDQIEEAYDEESAEQQFGANAEKQQKPQITQYENADVLITTDAGEKQQISQHDNKIPTQYQKQQKVQVQVQQKQQQKQQDIEIAYQNFQVALNIYQKQKNNILSGIQSVLSLSQIQRSIMIIYSRLGDLYMLDQHFPDAIDAYRMLIKIQSQKPNHLYNRRIAQSHFMIGNCMLLQNKQNCQKQAIQEYVDAVKILVKFIQVQEHYDVGKFQLPTMHKIRVDRYAYLNSPGDSAKVQEIKEVVSLILDKIQDTFEQIDLRKSYQDQKTKMTKSQEDSGFKEVSKDVKVTNLGTFGNRKRSPAGQDSNSVSTSSTKVKAQISPIKNVQTKNDIVFEQQQGQKPI